MHSRICVGFCLLALALGSCSEFKFMQPDSKQQAKERWSNMRGRLKLEMAQESYKAGQLDQALSILAECLSLDPQSGETYVLNSKILLEKGETAQASEALDEAMRHGSDNAETDYL